MTDFDYQKITFTAGTDYQSEHISVIVRLVGPGLRGDRVRCVFFGWILMEKMFTV